MVTDRFHSCLETQAGSRTHKEVDGVLSSDFIAREAFVDHFLVVKVHFIALHILLNIMNLVRYYIMMEMR